MIDEVLNNTCYDFKKVRLQKFMDARVLKSTETTTVPESESFKISVSDDELSAFSYEKKRKAQRVSIGLKTLVQIFLLSVCNFPVNIDNTVAWCGKCDNPSPQIQCKSKTDVKMLVVSESDQLFKYDMI